MQNRCGKDPQGLSSACQGKVTTLSVSSSCLQRKLAASNILLVPLINKANQRYFTPRCIQKHPSYHLKTTKFFLHTNMHGDHSFLFPLHRLGSVIMLPSLCLLRSSLTGHILCSYCPILALLHLSTSSHTFSIFQTMYPFASYS